MTRKHPRWSTSLARPIMVKDGPTLRTLHDVRAFMLGLPEGIQLRQSWQKAAELLIAAADGNGDVDATTRQTELALFLEAKLGLSK
jgi:hypothetical protein